LLWRFLAKPRESAIEGALHARSAAATAAHQKAAPLAPARTAAIASLRRRAREPNRAA